MKALFQTSKYQLYLFQLENYNIRRFLGLISIAIWRKKGESRQRLIWTQKAKVLFGLAVVLEAAAAYLFAAIYAGVTGKIFLVVLFFIVLNWLFFFVFLILAAILLSPVDYILKKIIIERAKRKIAKFPDLKIIGITGSYGKTTMKDALAAVLAAKFKVLKTPDSVNTPLGIANLMLKQLTATTQILIVEMGAYGRGDIARICEITKPHISILTGINEAHLERFGSIENTILAKFEIIDCLRDGGLAVVNGDNEYIQEEYEAHPGKYKLVFYSARSGKLVDYKIENYRFYDDGSGIGFNLSALGQSLGDIRLPVIGDYILGVVIACVIVSRTLGMSTEEISGGTREIRPAPHRLQPIQNPNGILVIDDSYNGNPDGVHEAIMTLQKFSGRRKIYLTPGLVEMGDKTKQIHENIGKELAGAADLVILIETSVTGHIARGLAEVGFSEDKIMKFPDAQAAHAALPEILKKGDVILFQNDWPDNYA